MPAKSTTGASYAVQVLQNLGVSASPPLVERGTIGSDMRLMPDNWTADPFWPQNQAPDGVTGFDTVWHLQPGQSGEPGLVGVTDSGGGSLEHTHPMRALQPGDRVLLVWASGVPVVLEVL
jgi:hypothetical protein